MSTQDHSQVLAFYRALRIEAEAEEAARRAAWKPEPLEVVTARIRAMVAHYLST
jgi:hypothetical protein